MNWRPLRPDFEGIHQSHKYICNISHPRLFFSAKDIPELKARAQKIMPQLLSRADNHLTAPAVRAENLYASLGQIMSRLSDLGAAFVLTGETRYGEGIKNVLDQAFAIDPWIYPVHQPTEFDHASANVSAAVAIAIDFLGDFITAAERKTLKQRLVDKTCETFRRVYSHRSEHWVKSVFNWRPMICSDMGLVLLTVLEEYPNFREAMSYALDGILAILDNAPQDGEWGEGISYWGAAIGLPLRFAIALDRITKGAINLFQHPYLQVTGDFLLHSIGPNGRVFNFADCGPTINSRHYALLGLLGQKLNRPHWKKLALQGEPTDLFELVCMTGVKDPGTLPDPPKAKHFREYDIVILRSGWKEKDTFLALKAGPSVVGHAHLDINTFMVSAFGETLIPDLGTWPYAHYLGFFDTSLKRWDFDANSSLGHNVILVDGQGQQYSKQHYGKIIKFRPSAPFDLVICNSANAYNPLLRKYLRWFVFIKPDLLIIFDDLRSDRARKVEWLLHYEGNVEVSESDLRVRKGEAGFDLNFLLPPRDQGWIAAQTVRRTVYVNSNTGKIERPENRFVAFSTLHPYPELRFLAVISLYKHQLRERSLWKPELIGVDQKSIRLKAQRGAETTTVILHLEKREVYVIQ